MQKFKKISYIFLIVVVIVLGFVIYSISSSDNGNDIREKAKAEILYFEDKIINMFNALNNVEFENYKLSVEEISQQEKETTEKPSSSEDESSSNSGSEKGGSKSSNTEGEDSNKKFSLNIKGILTDDKNINWNYIKNEAEVLQSSISTMTLDLYEISLNNTDVLNFGKEFDKLLIALKNEDKNSSLKELTTLYMYIAKFIKNCNIDIQKEIVISTKYSIFKAYSNLDNDNWDDITKDIQEASDKFAKLITNVNIENDNQYLVNKCYVLLNELQNSVNLKDKEIFLIKYRNLLEELNNL